MTKGLRKVDKSEMTHKNPELRAGSVVPGSSGPARKQREMLAWNGADIEIASRKPIKPSKPQALAGRKPAKFSLDGNKWAIVSDLNVIQRRLLKRVQEYQENETELLVEDTEINQAVNIFGCKSSTVVIKGKVNAVTLGELQESWLHCLLLIRTQ